MMSMPAAVALPALALWPAWVAFAAVPAAAFSPFDPTGGWSYYLEASHGSKLCLPGGRGHKSVATALVPVCKPLILPPLAPALLPALLPAFCLPAVPL
eukprot:SAG22_NODE_976_length_6199_cov_1.414426_7_plen_98_part_00